MHISMTQKYRTSYYQFGCFLSRHFSEGLAVTMFKYFLWATMLFMLIKMSTASNIIPTREKVCTSIIIEQANVDTELSKVFECEIIEGSLVLANFIFNSSYNHQVSHLREITGNLIIYRVTNLETLNIFSNLVTIRGYELFGKYSLIIFENKNLKELGFNSMKKIVRGSIRIENNPILCYVATVNWMYLVTNLSEQHYTFRHNKNPDHCPICQMADPNVTVAHKNIHCWSKNSLQKICPKICESGSCTSSGECCDPNCLSDCPTAGSKMCKVCMYLKSATDGECVNNCQSSYYKLNDRRCVPAPKCESIKLIPHNGSCLAKCPSGYYERNSRCIKCDGQCEIICNGTVIRNSEDTHRFKGCTHINGSLVIELREKRTQIIKKLEDNLSDIVIISGYLKIYKSPQITSLYFLRNLKEIQGNQLIQYKYSLFIMQNYHLEQLWKEDRNITIAKGKMFFYFNPKLCYEKIQALQPNTTLNVVDVSKSTNGDVAICSPNLTNLTTSIEAKNATAVRVKLEPIMFDDKRVFLGYFYYYTEAPEKNLTIFDGRHGCGHDNWNFDLDLSKNVRHIFSNLKPYTQYAYFVKTFTVPNTHSQLDAYSQVDYFTTSPSKPGPVWKILHYAHSDTQIALHWWPPKYPNGPIKHYVIDFVPMVEEVKENGNSFITNVVKSNGKGNGGSGAATKPDAISPVKKEECICPGINKWRGYTPVVEHYYDQQEIIFEDSLSDFVYIPHTKVVRDSESKLNSQNFSKSDALEKLIDEINRRTLKEWDTGTADFPIIEPSKSCEATKQSTLENSCSEHQTGTFINGKVHNHILENLSPNTVYKISISVCGDADMCSSKVTIKAATKQSAPKPKDT